MKQITLSSYNTDIGMNNYITRLEEADVTSEPANYSYLIIGIGLFRHPNHTWIIVLTRTPN